MPVLLLISDANILIDLECAGLSEAMFSLGYRFGVPDVLFAEELEERHAHLLDLGLEVRPLSPTMLADMERLAARYRKPSRNDLFALALARAERCPLLTGDGDLRAAAKTEETEVRGIPCLTICIYDCLHKTNFGHCMRLKAASIYVTLSSSLLANRRAEMLYS